MNKNYRLTSMCSRHNYHHRLRKCRIVELTIRKPFPQKRSLGDPLLSSFSLKLLLHSNQKSRNIALRRPRGLSTRCCIGSASRRERQHNRSRLGHPWLEVLRYQQQRASVACSRLAQDMVLKVRAASSAEVNLPWWITGNMSIVSRTTTWCKLSILGSTLIV